LPAQATVRSYAIDDDRENEVNRLDVFILDEAGNILPNVGHQTIRSFAQGGSTITASVALDRSVPKQQFYVIANATDLMLASATNRATIEALTFAAAKMPQQLFIMSGASQLRAVADIASGLSLSISRTVARLDIKLDNVVTNFKLKSVRLMNVRNQSHMFQKLAAGKVTFPATSALVQYPTVPLAIAQERGFASLLYAFENYNADPKVINNTTSIMLGGEYAASGVTTFYRIEVKDDAGAFQILRNNLYAININKVDGPGFVDENDAAIGTNANLRYTIEQWKQSDVNAEFDGTLSLAVSERQLNMPRDAFGGMVIVKTTADTWGLTSPVDISGTPATWLTVKQDGDVCNYMAPTNATGKARTAYFYITAGSKLRIKLQATQAYGDNAMVKLSTTSIAAPYAGAGIDAGSLPLMADITTLRKNIKWEADPAFVKFGETSDWVNFVAGIPTSGTGVGIGDTWQLSFAVASMAATTPSRSAILKLKATDQNTGVSEYYKLTIVQLNNQVPTISVDRLYMAAMGDGMTLPLKITSNGPWKASLYYYQYEGISLMANTSNKNFIGLATDATGNVLLPDYNDAPPHKGWCRYDGSGNDILYVKFFNIAGTNTIFDGYIGISDPTGKSQVWVRIHHGDYNPVTVNGLTILDRNLGATSRGTTSRSITTTRAEAAKAMGYRYQWGNVPNGYETLMKYDAAARTAYISPRTVSSVPVEPNKPFTRTNGYGQLLIGNGYSWFTVDANTPDSQRDFGRFLDANAVSTIAAADITKTNPLAGVKTTFDPCPEGYRVPTALELKQIFLGPTSLSSLDANQFGRWILESTATPADVYFPASGACVYLGNGFYAPLENSATKDMASIATEGYYMSSSPAGDNSRYHYMFFNQDKAEMRNARHPGCGAIFTTGLMSVRCVKAN
ncbi:MAG: hypothetical protein RR931_03105, partial [Mucinivorans sp.]